MINTDDGKKILNDGFRGVFSFSPDDHDNFSLAQAHHVLVVSTALQHFRLKRRWGCSLFSGGQLKAGVSLILYTSLPHIFLVQRPACPPRTSPISLPLS